MIICVESYATADDLSLRGRAVSLNRRENGAEQPKAPFTQEVVKGAFGSGDDVSR